jgi:hypothetical protein
MQQTQVETSKPSLKMAVVTSDSWICKFQESKYTFITNLLLQWKFWYKVVGLYQRNRKLVQDHSTRNLRLLRREIKQQIPIPAPQPTEKQRQRWWQSVASSFVLISWVDEQLLLLLSWAVRIASCGLALFLLPRALVPGTEITLGDSIHFYSLQ